MITKLSSPGLNTSPDLAAGQQVYQLLEAHPVRGLSLASNQLQSTIKYIDIKNDIKRFVLLKLCTKLCTSVFFLI